MKLDLFEDQPWAGSIVHPFEARAPSRGAQALHAQLFETGVTSAQIVSGSVQLIRTCLKGYKDAGAHRPIDEMSALAWRGPLTSADATKRLLDTAYSTLPTIADNVLLGSLARHSDFPPPSDMVRWVRNLVGPLRPQPLGLDITDHAAKLNWLKSRDPEVLRLIIDLNLGDASRRVPFPGLSKEESILLVVDHAVLMLVLVARMRATLINRWGTKPLVGLDGGSTWITQHRAFLDVLRAGAANMDALLGQPLTSSTGKAGVLSHSVRGGFLRNDARIVPIIDHIERQVRGLITKVGHARACRIIERQLRLGLGLILEVDDTALRDDDLGRMSFVEDRLGLTAFHAVVAIAMNLLAGRQRAEACVQAVLASRPLPSFSPLRREHVGSNALQRVTQDLRVGYQTDKHAPGSVAEDDHHTGAKMIRKALKAFARPEAQAGLELLGFDPLRWFA